MLFSQEAWAGIADGSITLTYRHWSRPQAVAGRRYRTPAGMIEVVDVRVVDTITDEERARTGGYDVGEPPWTRVEFRYVGDDPRTALQQDTNVEWEDLGPLDPILRLIAEHPGVRAGDLAERLGRERLAFKADVRKLKARGLTESLAVGYRLSPRGEAFLRCAPSATGR